MSYPPPGYGPPGYGPPGYGPQGYGPPGYGGGYGVDHPQGTIVLVLGILGIVTCPLCGPFAWSMGTKALREIDANPAAYRNRSLVNAGRICGIVATVLIAVQVVFGILWFALFFGTLGASSV